MGLWRPVLLVVGLLGTSSGCVVPRPGPDQLAGYDQGFSTPEGAFESLRTAFQAQVLEWEFRCFSQRFRDENQLSQQAYRAFRPQLLGRIPHLRWGLVRAVVEEVEMLSPGRALLIARVPVPLTSDPRMEVLLVREEYAELYAGPWDVASAEPLTGRLQVDTSQPGEFGEGYVWIRLDATRPLTDPDLARDFTRLTGAREWKVDGIGLLED
jgi:hypothetical protein